MKPGLENEFGSGDELTPEYEPADYTKDWRSIANLGGETSYPARVTLLIWKRRNWQTKLSGEWIDELVEDFQRRYRWNKELSEWVAEHGNPEWPR